MSGNESDLLGRLGLDDLLRYAGAGAVFMLFIGAFDRGLIIGHGALSRAGGLAGVILLAGALIYSAHRAFLHPIIERQWLLPKVLKHVEPVPKSWKIQKFPFPSQLEVGLSGVRIKRRELHPEAARYFGRWATHTHFLYCACWAALAGQAVVILDGTQSCHGLRWSMGASVAILIAIAAGRAAYLDDVRLYAVELALYKSDLPT